MKEEFDLTHSDLSFLENLANYTFESKMLFCQAYSSRIMTSSEVSAELMLTSNIMPWELEAFAAFSVIYDSPEAKDQMNDKEFCNIITLLRNYWHPELTIAKENGTYSDYFMMVSTLQQFPVQGTFLQKLFRYNFFFNFKNDNLNMKATFEEMFENEYRQFELFAFIIFATCSSEGQNLLQRELCHTALSKAFSIGSVYKQLSIDKNEYKRLLDSQYNGKILDYYYGLKIQYLYPIIEDLDCSYIPSPYLVVNAVTASMLNRLTLGKNALRRRFGKEVIEEYLFSIYRELNTVTWISREFEYFVGRDRRLTPDVLVEEMDKAILFDTKALSPSLKMRQFDKEEIEKETNTYATDILQLYRRILDLNNGHFTLQSVFERNDIFGVVVVLEDAAIPKHKVYDRVFEMLKEEGLDVNSEICDYIHSHIKVIPLYQIEQTVLIGHSYMECLLNQVVERNKWDDYSFFIPKKNISCIPTFKSYCDELKKEAARFLTE